MLLYSPARNNDDADDDVVDDAAEYDNVVDGDGDGHGDGEGVVVLLIRLASISSCVCWIRAHSSMLVHKRSVGCPGYVPEMRLAVCAMRCVCWVL